MPTKVLSALLFVVACLLLYVGFVMLFFIPGPESASDRWLWGVLPLLGSLTLLSLAGWLWARTTKAAEMPCVVFATIGLGPVAVFLFFVALAVISALR